MRQQLALAVAFALAATPTLAACPPSIAGTYVVVLPERGVCQLAVDAGGNVSGSCNPVRPQISIVRGPSGGLSFDRTTCRVVGDLTSEVRTDLGAGMFTTASYVADVTLWANAAGDRLTGFGATVDAVTGLRSVAAIELIAAP